MVLSTEQAIDLISSPDKAAEIVNLHYVSEPNLCIERKLKGKSFQYFMKGKRIKDQKVLKRIEELVIPPAWEQVRICSMDNGHLQAIGRDLKNRKQYLYHPQWNQIRNQTKFFKLVSFGKMLPKIRQQIEQDLKLEGMPQRKVVALVIKLMEETHIRIGNDSYARRNKSYGLSTLRSRHLKFSKSRLKFNFIGKRGKEHSVTIRNKKLIKLVNQCEEIPGWEIFQYYQEDGQKKSLDSGMVNEYIHELCGVLYSAKDFRTWSATTIFFEQLRQRGYEQDETENEKAIIEAYDTTASALGNTRAVCRKYYVHPMVVAYYKSGEIVPYFEKISRKRTTRPHISPTEEILLEMLSDFELELKQQKKEKDA